MPQSNYIEQLTQLVAAYNGLLSTSIRLWKELEKYAPKEVVEAVGKELWEATFKRTQDAAK